MAITPTGRLTPFAFSQIMWSYAKVNKEGEPDDTLVIMDEKEYAGCVENKDVILMPYNSQALDLTEKYFEETTK